MNISTTLRPSTKSIHNHFSNHNHAIIHNELTNKTNNEVSIPKPTAKKPQLFLSTNPSHVNINLLSQLYISCNHSPHRFPSSTPSADVVEGKLETAVSHSAFIVSVFAAREEERRNGLWGRMVSVSPENGDLVGFGRVVSDLALTASIFDVMVIPTLRRLGIGRMIVQRILRMLSNRGIYDISALCSDEERLFFAACGFGDDVLGSTTMTYSQTASSYRDNSQIITRAGQKLLVAPPLRLPFSSYKRDQVFRVYIFLACMCHDGF